MHTLVVLEDEAELALVDDYGSPARGSTGLASVVVEQALGRERAAQLRPPAALGDRYLALLDPDARAWRRTHTSGRSTSRSGHAPRATTSRWCSTGSGAQADLLGMAAADGRQHVDFETLQDHFGDRTRSDLFIHDALRGRSSANFTGLIRIEKTAHQTESAQTQKNVLLSARSRADSDPKLEILNNDVVRCTHGASVGPVDEELVFYLQSRGLDRPSAERLIVEGFFQAVLEKLAQPDLQAAVWSAVAEKLVLEDGR